VQIVELQATLERAWRDLSEQKKINSGLGGQLEIKALEVEAKSKEEYQQLYKKLQAEYSERESALTQVGSFHPSYNLKQSTNTT